MAVVLVALLQMIASLQPRIVDSLVALWGREIDDSCFALILCYTGLRPKVGYPYAQIMAKIGVPRYQQEKDNYEQKQMTIHDIPFQLLL